MNQFHVVFALDRHPEAVDALSGFVAMHAPVFWFNAGKKVECRDINIVFRNGNGWPYHEGPWHLFHQEKTPVRSMWFDPYEHHTIEERTKVLQEMANSYSWAILPWGREQSMAMIAFVTAEGRHYDEFIATFKDSSTRLSQSGLFVSDLATSAAPLLLAAYKNIDSLTDRCHGLLFNDTGTAQKLWEFTDSGKNPPYVLHFRQTGPKAEPRSVPAGNFENLETYADKRDLVRVLVRVLSRETLAAYLANWGTALVIAGNADLRSLRVIFQAPDFQIHTAPYYSTRMISGADWIYFPENGQSTTVLYETLFGKNAQLVSSFLGLPCFKPLSLYSCF